MYSCEGEWMETIEEIYNGGPDSDVTINYTYKNGNTTVTDSYTDKLYNNFGVGGFGCMRRPEGDVYECYSAAAGGYGPFGPQMNIKNYGTYEIPLYSRAQNDCEEGVGEGVVVEVSRPKLFLVLSKNN